MQPKDLDDYFLPFYLLLKNGRSMLRTRHEALIGSSFATSQPLVDKIIVGISNLSQLKDIASLSTEHVSGELSFPELAHSSTVLPIQPFGILNLDLFKPVIGIQARLSSSRLPCKAMLSIGGTSCLVF